MIAPFGNSTEKWPTLPGTMPRIIRLCWALPGLPPTWAASQPWRRWRSFARCCCAFAASPGWRPCGSSRRQWVARSTPPPRSMSAARAQRDIARRRRHRTQRQLPERAFDGIDRGLRLIGLHRAGLIAAPVAEICPDVAGHCAGADGRLDQDLFAGALVQRRAWRLAHRLVLAVFVHQGGRHGWALKHHARFCHTNPKRKREPFASLAYGSGWYAVISRQN